LSAVNTKRVYADFLAVQERQRLGYERGDYCWACGDFCLTGRGEWHHIIPGDDQTVVRLCLGCHDWVDRVGADNWAGVPTVRRALEYIRSEWGPHIGPFSDEETNRLVLWIMKCLNRLLEPTP